MSEPRPVEPEIAAILAAAGGLKPTKVTFINHLTPIIFTIDIWKDGLRLIYSRGFLSLAIDERA